MLDSRLPLPGVHLFQGLAEEDLADIQARVTLRTFGRGDDLLLTGQATPGLFVLKTGAVSAFVTADGGIEREVATLGPGECVGEMALLSGEPPSATVRAMTDTEAWFLEPGAFVELLESHPGLWRNLGHILSKRLARTSKHLLARTHSSLIPLLLDCGDDEAAVLAPAVAASLARQTGKRVLLVDGRGAAARKVEGDPGRTAAPLYELLEDKSLLARHEAAGDTGNGLNGARVVALGGEGGLNENQHIAALEMVMPAYDFVLLLDGRGRASGPRLLERARSVLALVTPDESRSPPAWLKQSIEDLTLRHRLEVAMLAGDKRGVFALEEIEDILGRAVVRLPLSKESLQLMAERGRPAAADQAAIDRLARLIGEIEVGVALGAGAAKGFAHIGVLRVLQEQNVPIDYLAGCSIGAVVGAMFAFGLPLDEIAARMQGVDRKLKRWTLPFRSLWSDAGLKELLRSPAPTVRFRDLQLPFAAVATDVVTGREIPIRKGLVWRAVQASTSVPGIFPAVLLNGRYLVDGGLVNPVPSQTVRHLGADIVIAVDLMSPSGQSHHLKTTTNGRSGKKRLPNLVEMLWRANEIMQEEVTLRSAATADITIAPPLGRVRWSDFSQRGKEFIAVGEAATRGKIAEMRDLIPFMSAVAAA
ncbi:MAG TPA: patatin-like phospholipase family protein [Dehalococcoidia bacterium]|nr:patatin-like phospholipase family protein [Dehalococcoidia bacterium]